MQRESYWDYMARRMREESNGTHRAVVYHDTHRKSSSERELNNWNVRFASLVAILNN
jgi:hypothetical protein